MKFVKEKYLHKEQNQEPAQIDFAGTSSLPDEHANEYGNRALKTAYEMVMNAQDGEKWDTLRKAGKLLGGYVAGGMVSYTDAELALRNAIDQRDCDSYEDAYKTICSSLEHGQSQPFTFDELEAERKAYIASLSSKNGSVYRNDKPQKTGIPARGKISFDDPEPLDIPLPEVEAITPDMLPNSFRHWLKDIAERMQVPFEFVACSAISMVSAIVGTRCAVKPKQKDDWVVIPNLWGGIIGTPSMLKTPSLNEVLKPLKKLEVEAMQDYQKELATFEAEKEVFKAQKEAISTAMKNAAKGKGSKDLATLQAEYKALAEQEPKPPTLCRYMTNDSTPEKLADLINENPNGLLVFRDELTGLLSSFEKVGHEQARGFYLEGWTGNGAYTVDRVQKGSIFISKLCLTVFGGIQPDKLKSYLNQVLSGENDGLVQRFQLLVYPDEPKHWSYTDAKPDTGAKDRAYQVVKTLATVEFKSIGAITSAYEQTPHFHFTPDAQSIFKDWLTDLHRQLKEDDLHAIEREHLAKYRSLLPSLALIFHLLDLADGAKDEGGISKAATEKALQWCRVLRSHAKRIYNGLGNTEDNAVLALARKLKAGKVSDTFTVREVVQKGWAYLNRTKEVKKAVAELINAGWIIELPVPENREGRPKAPAYLLNPKIKTKSFL